LKARSEQTTPPHTRSRQAPWLAVSLVPFVVLAQACFGSARAQDAAASQVIRLRTGAARTLSLSENRTTGYGWSISGAESGNLGILRIADLGSGVTTGGGGNRSLGERAAPVRTSVVAVQVQPR